jgi:hypothetical protein
VVAVALMVGAHAVTTAKYSRSARHSYQPNSVKRPFYEVP